MIANAPSNVESEEVDLRCMRAQDNIDLSTITLP